MKFNKISYLGLGKFGEATNKLIAYECKDINFNIVEIKKNWTDYINNKELNKFSNNYPYLNKRVDVEEANYGSSYFQKILLEESKKLKSNLKK